MIYQWKDSAFKSGDPQAVGDRLNRIRESNPKQRLAARDVVVDARREDSPLHRYFEWRDSVAALKYRETQARELIRSLVVIYDERPDTPVPAFVCIEQGAEEFGPYQATHVALAEPESRDYVLTRARQELAAWRKRYASLQELADVLSVVDEALGKLETVSAV